MAALSCLLDSAAIRELSPKLVPKQSHECVTITIVVARLPQCLHTLASYHLC